MSDYRCKHDALLAAGPCIQCIEEENEILKAEPFELRDAIAYAGKMNARAQGGNNFASVVAALKAEITTLKAEVGELRARIVMLSGESVSVCGDCRKLIRDACACSDHLRICEEQQRAEQAERERDEAIEKFGLAEEWRRIWKAKFKHADKSLEAGEICIRKAEALTPSRTFADRRAEQGDIETLRLALNKIADIMGKATKKYRAAMREGGGRDHGN